MNYKMNYKAVMGVGIILGMLISIQFKSVNQQNGGTTTLKKAEQLTRELESLKRKELKLKNEIQETKETIQKYKEETNNKEQEKISLEIKKYEKLSGYTDVEGPGIEMNINTKVNSNSSIVYNFDLILSIINKLNSAQAEAISINNQRIVNDSYIKLEGESLKINDITITEPINIKAIGNKETLEAALKIKYGVIWEMEKYYNTNVEVSKKDNIKINKYSDKIELRYSEYER